MGAINDLPVGFPPRPNPGSLKAYFGQMRVVVIQRYLPAIRYLATRS